MHGLVKPKFAKLIRVTTFIELQHSKDRAIAICLSVRIVRLRRISGHVVDSMIAQ